MQKVNGTPLTQGLRASSLQFTSPLEFNAIFRDGFTLRHELTAGSKIRDPVPAKFKHVMNIVICTLLCCDYVTCVLALKFPKSWLRTLGYRQKIHHFFFSHKIFTFYESKQMSLTQDLRWSLGRRIALQLQRRTDLLLCTINCFLQWDHLPNMAVGELAFYYTLYLCVNRDGCSALS